MAEIVLTTVTARYSHTAFGLRYLRANLGPYRDKSNIIEFHLKQPPILMAEAILNELPKIVGVGVYIWNLNEVTELVQIIKRVVPHTIVVIGGPEVSYEYDTLPIFHTADYLVRGEGELSFAKLVGLLMDGARPDQKVWEEPVDRLDTLVTPYAEYTDTDLQHRIIYVESTRGCPFRCEFCLSSIRPGVRFFNRERFFAEMDTLLQRGAKNFTFVDRTFNIHEAHATEILSFFLERVKPGMRIHFEIVPDRLSNKMLEWIQRFPPEVLHLEVGVQTVNPETQRLISRRQDLNKTREVLEFLCKETGAQVHVDLVAGMPAETWDTLREGFDFLINLSPDEIQLGILKRLRGAPIARHTEEFGLVFAPFPPYEILKTHTLSFEQMQRIKRMARYLEIYYNQHNFDKSLQLLWQTERSPFDAFDKFSEFIWQNTGKTHELSLSTLAQLLYQYLVSTGKFLSDVIESTIYDDYNKKPGRTEKLHFGGKKK